MGGVASRNFQRWLYLNRITFTPDFTGIIR
jgi:hypothetical protein